MKSVRILVDDKIPFINGALDDVARVVYKKGSDIGPDDVRDMDALIIRTRTKCNRDLLDRSAVRCIATATIGFDHIDTDYCERNKIFWTNAPGCNSSSVEQYFISAVLELSKRMNFLPENLNLGIIGVGHVGSKVAKAALALGMKVRLNDPPRERKEGKEGFVSLDTIRKESDIISFHVPLNREGPDRTYRMADRNFFRRLSKPVHLINTSRGPVIDEGALLSAIKNGTVQSCVLDVWENEPVIHPELLSSVDLATPHIAGYSTDGKANGTAMSVRAVSRFFGLGRDDWMPSDLPEPENNPLIIECKGLSELEILGNIYHQTYSIALDDRMLRDNLSAFEYLRGNYRLRREPSAFKVQLKNNKFETLTGKLEKLGFMILN